VATQHAWACQCTVPTRRRARELEARWAARGVGKEAGSRGAVQGLVVGCMVSTSSWRSGLDSGRSVQQGDVTPQRQRGLLAVCKRGGRRRDVMAAHRGLDGAPWRRRGRNFTGGQHGVEQTQAGSGDGRPRCTAADAMAQGGRWTHDHPCGAEW
jgi:hypothetical protein